MFLWIFGFVCEIFEKKFMMDIIRSWEDRGSSNLILFFWIYILLGIRVVLRNRKESNDKISVVLLFFIL